jgi:hypothetical protein
MFFPPAKSAVAASASYFIFALFFESMFSGMPATFRRRPANHKPGLSDGFGAAKVGGFRSEIDAQEATQR